MFKITSNTDAVDIDQKCLGLDATRDSFPRDVRDHIQRERGLHIQIRHNRDKQTFAQANDLSNLIAAAPEMLWALKRAQAALARVGVSAGFEDTIPAISAAIAKGEGGS